MIRLSIRCLLVYLCQRRWGSRYSNHLERSAIFRVQSFWLLESSNCPRKFSIYYKNKRSPMKTFTRIYAGSWVKIWWISTFRISPLRWSRVCKSRIRTLCRRIQWSNAWPTFLMSWGTPIANRRKKRDCPWAAAPISLTLMSLARWYFSRMARWYFNRLEKTVPTWQQSFPTVMSWDLMEHRQLMPLHTLCQRVEQRNWRWEATSSNLWRAYERQWRSGPLHTR